MFTPVITFLAAVSIPIAVLYFFYVLIVSDELMKGFLFISGSVSALYGAYHWLGICT